MDRAIRETELTEPGWYWWLPGDIRRKTDKLAWDTAYFSGDKEYFFPKGWFVGPLKAPVDVPIR